MPAANSAAAAPSIAPFRPPATSCSAPLHRIREFTLCWQDGLNFRDTASKDRFAGLPTPLVADCMICNDSYDMGEEAVNCKSAPFNVRLRNATQWPESHFNLNQFKFDNGFFALDLKDKDKGTPAVNVLRVRENEEVVIHVVHPGGRARQRAFVTIGQDYDDLFPGFGFPRAALVGPGKAMTASLTKKAKPGCYLWHDGPTHLWSGGVWGLLDVIPDQIGGQMTDFSNPAIISCARGAIDQPSLTQVQ